MEGVSQQEGEGDWAPAKAQMCVHWGSSEGKEQGESCGAGDASAMVAVAGEPARPSSCTGDTGTVRPSLLGAVVNLDYSS